MAYYVFRINYNEYFSLIRKELIINKRLRQGWGTYDMRADQGYEVYKAGWQAHWGKSLSDDKMRLKYNNIAIMTEIETGDYIIIPKISMENDYVCRSFAIAKCKKKYQFAVLDEAADFGHFIEVENVFSCGYDKNYFSHL